MRGKGNPITFFCHCRLPTKKNSWAVIFTAEEIYYHRLFFFWFSLPFPEKEKNVCIKTHVSRRLFALSFVATKYPLKFCTEDFLFFLHKNVSCVKNFPIFFYFSWRNTHNDKLQCVHNCHAFCLFFSQVHTFLFSSIFLE